MTEPMIKRLEHDAEHLLHGVAGHFGHHGYDDRNSPGFVPEEHIVSLATDVANIRQTLENAAEWIKQGIETHLPSAEAELAKIQNSKVAQTLESVVLTPAEEDMVSKIIEGLPLLRVSATTGTADPAPSTPAEDDSEAQPAQAAPAA